MYGTTSHHHPDDNHSESSSSSGDFMAHPFQAFRPSLFVSLQSPDGEPSPEAPQNDTLPSLHDQSWIGARMSPIDKALDDDHGTGVTYHMSQSQQPPPFLSLNHQHAPSAGHHRKEYPPFGIHPLQAAYLSPLRTPANKEAWKFTFGTWGSVLIALTGFSLFGMGILDAYVGRIDGFSGERAWSLPWGQPSLKASVLGGGLIPSMALQIDTEDDAFRRSYWRFLSSSVQCNSLLEWLLIIVAWYVCARPSIYPLSTTMMVSIYTICTLTGQSWMLAVWWLTQQPSNNKNSQADILVAHCAAWGTCGVLCFVGMLRPKRRFGCFVICIGFVLLSLLQAVWCINASEQVRNPLPLVAGCIASAFVGWLLYGSQLILGGKTDLSVLRRPDQLPSVRLSVMATQRRPQIHPGVKMTCTVVVMILWMLPLLVLAYFDHFYFLYRDETDSGG